MKNSTFVWEGMDEFEFNIGTNLPYIAIKLTNLQFKHIEHKKLDIYSIDNKIFLEIRDKEGKSTGDMMFFLIFK